VNPSRISPSFNGTNPFAKYNPEEQARRSVETKLVNVICKTYGISVSKVRQAVFELTGEDDGLTMQGLNRYLNEPFPFTFGVYVAKSGKGTPITLSALLRSPEKIPIIAHFLRTIAVQPNGTEQISLRRKHNRLEEPPIVASINYRIVVGSHPRLPSYIAVTDYPINVEGIACFSFNAPTGAEENVIRLTLGTFENILWAFKKESGWTPC
jgi:hypothetical protein